MQENGIRALLVRTNRGGNYYEQWDEFNISFIDDSPSAAAAGVANAAADAPLVSIRC